MRSHHSNQALYIIGVIGRNVELGGDTDGHRAGGIARTAAFVGVSDNVRIRSVARGVAAHIHSVVQHLTVGGRHGDVSIRVEVHTVELPYYRVGAPHLLQRISKHCIHAGAYLHRRDGREHRRIDGDSHTNGDGEGVTRATTANHRVDDVGHLLLYAGDVSQRAVDGGLVGASSQTGKAGIDRSIPRVGGVGRHSSGHHCEVGTATDRAFRQGKVADGHVAVRVLQRISHGSSNDTAVGIRHRHRVSRGGQVRCRSRGITVVPCINVRFSTVRDGHCGGTVVILAGDRRVSHRRCKEGGNFHGDDLHRIVVASILHSYLYLKGLRSIRQRDRGTGGHILGNGKGGSIGAVVGCVAANHLRKIRIAIFTIGSVACRIGADDCRIELRIRRILHVDGLVDSAA